MLATLAVVPKLLEASTEALLIDDLRAAKVVVLPERARDEAWLSAETGAARGLKRVASRREAQSIGWRIDTRQ